MHGYYPCEPLPFVIGCGGWKREYVPGMKRDSSIGEMFDSNFTHEIWVDAR